MREYTEFKLTFYLDEEKMKRLEKIVEVFKENGSEQTLESAFRFIMMLGANHVIDEKMTFCEKQLGIKEW